MVRYQSTWFQSQWLPITFCFKTTIGYGTVCQAVRFYFFVSLFFVHVPVQSTSSVCIVHEGMCTGTNIVVAVCDQETRQHQHLHKR